MKKLLLGIVIAVLAVFCVVSTVHQSLALTKGFGWDRYALPDPDNGITFGYSQESSDWEYSNSSTGTRILTISTTANGVEINSNLIVPSISVATALIGVSQSTTLGLYSGSTLTQTFGSGYIEQGTTMTWVQGTTMRLVHSAPFTTVPAISLDIIPTVGNVTTMFYWTSLTPTTAVCTILIWKHEIAGTQDVFTQATTGECKFRWTAIGK